MTASGNMAQDFFGWGLEELESGGPPPSRTRQHGRARGGSTREGFEGFLYGNTSRGPQSRPSVRRAESRGPSTREEIEGLLYGNNSRGPQGRPSVRRTDSRASSGREYREPRDAENGGGRPSVRRTDSHASSRRDYGDPYDAWDGRRGPSLRRTDSRTQPRFENRDSCDAARDTQSRHRRDSFKDSHGCRQFPFDSFQGGRFPFDDFQGAPFNRSNSDARFETREPRTARAQENARFEFREPRDARSTRFEGEARFEFRAPRGASSQYPPGQSQGGRGPRLNWDDFARPGTYDAYLRASSAQERLIVIQDEALKHIAHFGKVRSTIKAYLEERGGWNSVITVFKAHAAQQDRSRSGRAYEDLSSAGKEQGRLFRQMMDDTLSGRRGIFDQCKDAQMPRVDSFHDGDRSESRSRAADRASEYIRVEEVDEGDSARPLRHGGMEVEEPED
jgi:hypothetical protein